ncbi:MAG TPA: RluA family pseudouridine synthase [Haliscomenobacter sp.]|uniref:RluA family pseudouridine synthase n=1 Tax=Haliscomenobacter sp. TaxID=2717303 RepID=UPI002C627B32|nr:RluA family pseudouridine synthase [Haliscomenobacter sp.]HOY16293.1 RluA family pseudouridine synthase [Haliscomenobacter sp.]HPH21274.1 RluA family pseudouridine synthase [Haliscomenobacter sp.]
MKAHPLKVIHIDEHIIVCEKPSGLLSIPDRFDQEKPNLYHLLEAQYGQVWIVHRIDRETSGILVFARNEDAHRALNQQFLDRTVEKIYLALVEGRPMPPTGEINKAIAPHPSIAGKMITSGKGKSALTLYKVVDTYKAYALVEADIKTGRTHQIRVHFASIGHPLAVDPVYGKRAAFFLSEIKTHRFNLKKDQDEEQALVSRLTLHAHKLTLDHPATGERMAFTCELPKDFRALLSQLDKWGR